MFAWIDAVARQAPTGSALNGQSTVRMWRALAGERNREGCQWLTVRSLGRTREGARSQRSRLGRLRRRALAGAFPFAIAALNRAGLGSFNADISSARAAPRRIARDGGGGLTARLGRRPRHFRPHPPCGSAPGDVAAEWRGPGGARLLNAGCWTYDAYFSSSSQGRAPTGLAVPCSWRTTARLCCCACSTDSPPRAQPLGASRRATPGVKHVARHSTPAPISSSSVASVWPRAR